LERGLFYLTPLFQVSPSPFGEGAFLSHSTLSGQPLSIWREGFFYLSPLFQVSPSPFGEGAFFGKTP
jgi:hypothetical protein